MNTYPTNKLFYNKYIYKMRVKADLSALFRGMNLAFAKEKIDEMQSYAERDMTIPSPFFRFRQNRDTVSLETFMDSYAIYRILEQNADKCSVRVENRCLDVYTNEKSWLLEFPKKVQCVGLWEPTNDKIADFLLDNQINTQITEKPIEWCYKAFLAKQVDPKFAEFCRNNKKHLKIGKVALEAIEKNHWTQGFYFRVKSEKYLMLAKIAAGSGITKVIKYVSQDQLA